MAEDFEGAGGSQPIDGNCLGDLNEGSPEDPVPLDQVTVHGAAEGYPDQIGDRITTCMNRGIRRTRATPAAVTTRYASSAIAGSK